MGGSSGDNGLAIALDAADNAYVTGLTGSSDFPTVGDYQSDQPNDDAFVAKIADAGSLKLYTWTFSFRAAGGAFATVWGTINNQPIYPPLYQGPVCTGCNYSGTIPNWANDLMLTFSYHASCE